MANWGASATVSAAANSTSYISNSAFGIVVDSFVAPQLPRRINTSALTLRSALNTNAAAAVTVGSAFTVSSNSSTTYRSAITYSNGFIVSYAAINRRPNRGQVYPRY